jgi:hypothetical protein
MVTVSISTIPAMLRMRLTNLERLDCIPHGIAAIQQIKANTFRARVNLKRLPPAFYL